MRKIYFFIVIFTLFLFSCKRRNVEEKEKIYLDSIEANSDTIGIDSLEKTPPATVDELFADFIFSYSTNKSFQFSRTDFPLTVLRNGKTSEKINRIDWKFDKLYYKHSLHIVILDSEEDLHNIKRVKTDTVKVEWMKFRNLTCKQYFFVKKRGVWRLDHIAFLPIKKHQDADFLLFYNRFASDTAFQIKHLSDNIYFTTYDTDNHFKKIDGTIDRSQWLVFHPELPADDIFNLDYGESLHSHRIRIVSVRGNSNGMSSMFEFKKKGGIWRITKFEN